jgi:hypothetical protein
MRDFARRARSGYFLDLPVACRPLRPARVGRPGRGSPMGLRPTALLNRRYLIHIGLTRPSAVRAAERARSITPLPPRFGVLVRQLDGCRPRPLRRLRECRSDFLFTWTQQGHPGSMPVASQIRRSQHIHRSLWGRAAFIPAQRFRTHLDFPASASILRGQDRLAHGNRDRDGGALGLPRCLTARK